MEPLINGLNRAIGRAVSTAAPVEYDSALAFGDVYASLVRAMVFNRLCATDSKLGCLEWLETVAIPGMPETVDHDQ